MAALGVILISFLTNFHLWRVNREYKKVITELNRQVQENKEKGLKVIEVTDGDTFIIEGGVRVRLADVNVPEEEFCLGQEAKKRGRKIYHFPGCAGYNVVIVELDRGEQWFCSEKEAQAAGFVKSEQCYGKKWRP